MVVPFDRATFLPGRKTRGGILFPRTRRVYAAPGDDGHLALRRSRGTARGCGAGSRGQDARRPVLRPRWIRHVRARTLPHLPVDRCRAIRGAPPVFNKVLVDRRGGRRREPESAVVTRCTHGFRERYSDDRCHHARRPIFHAPRIHVAW